MTTVAFVLAGAFVGLLGGLLALHLTDQALCPHGIFGPCRVLKPGPRGLIVVAGIGGGAVLGGIISAVRR
jgi:hypothetical protein